MNDATPPPPARPASGLSPRGLLRALAARLVGGVSHVATDRPVAALTFDDGPDERATGLILDILGRHGAKATFFVTGSAASRSPDLIRRMLAEGHEVGNHTFSHTNFSTVSMSEGRAEVIRTDAVLRPYRTRLVRPPFGKLSVSANLLLAAMRRRVILWSVTSSDWSEADPARVQACLERRMHAGAIVLLHDGLARAPHKVGPGISRETTCIALAAYLAQQGRPYSFLTVSELLKCGSARHVWLNSKSNGGAT